MLDLGGKLWGMLTISYAWYYCSLLYIYIYIYIYIHDIFLQKTWRKRETKEKEDMDVRRSISHIYSSVTVLWMNHIYKEALATGLNMRILIDKTYKKQQVDKMALVVINLSVQAVLWRKGDGRIFDVHGVGFVKISSCTYVGKAR